MRGSGGSGNIGGVETKWIVAWAAVVLLRSAAAQELDDLPLVEVPAEADDVRAPFAVLFSGDGGWASLDGKLAAALAREGVPVVGVNSLRYFWHERKPDEIAADLSQLLEHYSNHWHKSEAVVIGYSQGADVVPFALNRLDGVARALVRSAVLIAPSKNAAFEFHWVGWFGKDTGDTPTAPEIAKLEVPNVICLYGADDSKSVCPLLEMEHVHSEALPGGHRFDGDYEQLAAKVIAGLRAATSSAAP